ncbi:hypothetical protein C8R47DRAFT_1217441 [Mycena vitilis]|nr:hypothetical protein C8R47DRAFT_1217441 [Mycena vitilis]
MANGKVHKKLKTRRKIKQNRLDRQYELRSAASHVQTAAFLACHELVLYHMLEACTLASLITLSHTSSLFRTLVKTLFRIRLFAAVEIFVGRDNVANFFCVLEETDSAIGGSTLPFVLLPHAGDSDDDDDDDEKWMPNNLNLYSPLGRTGPWDTFFHDIGLPSCAKQPGVSRQHMYLTNSHIEYESKVPGRPIKVSESVDLCVITPATAACTTMGMCLATCSTFIVLYPQLVVRGRALESWNTPTIDMSIDLLDRGFLCTVSNMGWSKTCGWNCPTIWRHIQGLRGVGVFCWGGNLQNMVDNGSVGVPLTEVSPMMWRLGDTCKNVHCPWWKVARHVSSRSY